MVIKLGNTIQKFLKRYSVNKLRDLQLIFYSLSKNYQHDLIDIYITNYTIKTLFLTILI